MERERFEELARRAVEHLPEEFRQRLENVDIVIEDRAGGGLLGLYEGIPHTERGEGYNLAMPDRITLFRKPIEAICRSEAEVELEVEKTIRHEIAHHFGMDDDQLHRMGR
ncbi:MAG: metallopeptidase family protein [Dehalococcoidia bacterium]|nr:metallopeptidase family protein [Dehalococcoidia bacterium]